MGKKSLGIILVLIASLLWGVISLFSIPLTDYGFTALDKAFIRTLTSAIILGVVILIKDKSLFKIKLKHLPIFMITGIVGNLLTMFCYMLAIDLAGSSLAATLMYTSSVWVIIFCAIFFKEKITWQKIVSLVGVIVGCMVFALGGDVKPSTIGIIVGLLTGLCYSGFSIGSKMGKEQGYSSLTIVFYAFVCAAVSGAPFVNYNTVAVNFTTNVNSIVYFLLLSVICSTLPFFIYVIALKYLSTGTASILSTLEIVVATVVGLIFFPEGNNLGVLGVVGLCMVIIFLVFLELPIDKWVNKPNPEKEINE